jgi:hypothetical protein
LRGSYGDFEVPIEVPIIIDPGSSITKVSEGMERGA